MDFITKIAAAGAMGVSIYCIYKVYLLIEKEQERGEEARSNILKSINNFMLFAAFMAVFSLVIEFVRSKIAIEGSQTELPASIKSQFDQLATLDLYSLNQAGEPQEVKVTFRDTPYQLSAPLPSDFFSDDPLQLTPVAGGFLAQRQGNYPLTLGFIDSAQLVSPGGQVVVEQAASLPDDLFNLGLSYGPNSFLRVPNVAMVKNNKLAIKNLIDILSLEGSVYDRLKVYALKLLTQPRIMSLLEEDQYAAIVAALETGGIREVPHRFYELAQLYYSRARQLPPPAAELKSAYEAAHLSNLREYLTSYKASTWLKDTIAHPDEWRWYKEIAEDLNEPVLAWTN